MGEHGWACSMGENIGSTTQHCIVLSAASICYKSGNFVNGFPSWANQPTRFSLFSLYDLYVLQWCKGFSRRNCIHCFPHPPTQKDDFDTIFKYAHLSAPQTGYYLLSSTKCQTSALYGKTQKMLDRMSNLSSVLLRGKGISRKICHKSESDSAGVLPWNTKKKRSENYISFTCKS